MLKKPRLGQNFLVDADACRRVVAALGNIAQDAVLEVGPGRGALTRLLARTAGHLTLVEFDPALAAALTAEFADASNIEVRRTDILALDITALAAEQSAARGGKVVIVGNLPYYITSEILLHLIAHHAAIDRAVLMVQREVAERITASPGSSDYGVLSATMQLYGSVELLFTLPPSAFAPPPDVHSSVFRLRASFAQKRKTWANNLRNAGYTTEAVAAALSQAGHNPGVRAEAVDLLGMASVFRFLRNS